MMVGRIGYRRWGVGRAGESNGGKMGRTVIEQQFFKKMSNPSPLNAGKLSVSQ